MSKEILKSKEAQDLETREIRVSSKIELREQDEEGKLPTLSGYAAVFDKRSEDLGWFVEQFQKGAFTETLKKNDVRALAFHDPSRVLGRQSAGTLRLSEDSRGLKVEIDPPDTQEGRDIVKLVKRGDLDGMSIGFKAVKDSWDESEEPVLRTVIEAQLFEVSLITWPAYTDTEVAVRSLDQARKEASVPLEVNEAIVEVLSLG